MSSPSTSRVGRKRSESFNRRNRMQPLSTPPNRPQGMGDSGHNHSGSGGSGSVSTRHTDSSGAEALQNSPNLEGTRPSDSALIFAFEDNSPSRSAADRVNFPAFPLEQDGPSSVSAFERQYLVEAMPPQTVERRSFDRSSVAQSSGNNSPLAHIQHMQPSRPATANTYYSMSNASGSQEKLENEMRALMASTSDTQSYPVAFPNDQGGSPNMDPNALHSDADTPSILMHHDFPQPKSGYRREIEAKSRHKIRLAAQRLRNVISPLVKPGVTLRGTADVMEEAADQIVQMGDRVLQMEREITSLQMQLQAKSQMRPAGQW